MTLETTKGVFSGTPDELMIIWNKLGLGTNPPKDTNDEEPTIAVPVDCRVTNATNFKPNVKHYGVCTPENHKVIFVEMEKQGWNGRMKRMEEILKLADVVSTSSKFHTNLHQCYFCRAKRGTSCKCWTRPTMVTVLRKYPMFFSKTGKFWHIQFPKIGHHDD